MATTRNTRRGADPRPTVASVNNQQQQQQVTEIDLLALAIKLLEKWYIIAIVALVGALISGIYTFRFVTPMYEATTKLYVVNSKDTAINLSDLQIGNYLAKDYQEVFSNWHVHETVLQRLNLNYSYKQLTQMITVSNPSDTRILYIKVKSADPDEAQLMANEYARVAQEFIAVKMDTEQPNIFEEALRPTSPSSPNKTRNILLGFMLGLLLAVSVITVQFIADDRIRTADDIEKLLHLPTLGIVTEQGHDRASSGKKHGRKAKA